MDCKILAFEFIKILSLALQKIGKPHFTRSYLNEKMSMLLVLLWIHVSINLATCMKNSRGEEISGPVENGMR